MAIFVAREGISAAGLRAFAGPAIDRIIHDAINLAARKKSETGRKV